MGIDVDRMKERLASLKGEGSNKDTFWRPQDGEQSIRIVPTSDGDPFKDYWFHYNVGKNSGFLCPKKNFSDDCPICEFASRLWREGTENNDEESKKMAKSFFARQRFFSPVIVRGEEDRGPRIWGYGKMAYENLLILVLNPEYGDITDPETGIDLVLHYGKPPGASYPQTKLTPRRRSSELCENMTPESCKEVLESIPDMHNLFERKATADVEKLLDAYLSDDEVAETGSTETVKYDDTATSVDAAFAELGVQ